MIFIIDSGSTKSDWIAVDKNGTKLFDKIRTKGLNPEILTPNELLGRIQENDVLRNNKDKVEKIFFYGAGCGTEAPNLALEQVLRSYFTNSEVTVEEDTLAAVYSCINYNEPAVVCIMGTGSNCSYFDGKNVQQRVKSLGYIIMDDASGNQYGRQLIRDYFFKHMPENLRISFEEKYNMDEDFIKYNLYRQSNPNAYLATFAEFMFLHKESEYIKDLIKEGVRTLAKNMIFQYKEELKSAPVHFAGSIAFLSQEEIKAVGAEMGFKVGNFIRRPIDGLVSYHTKKLKS